MSNTQKTVTGQHTHTIREGVVSQLREREKERAHSVQGAEAPLELIQKREKKLG